MFVQQLEIDLEENRSGRGAGQPPIEACEHGRLEALDVDLQEADRPLADVLSHIGVEWEDRRGHRSDTPSRRVHRTRRPEVGPTRHRSIGVAGLSGARAEVAGARARGGDVTVVEFFVRKTYFRNYWYRGPFERFWSRLFPAEATPMGRRSAEYIRETRRKLGLDD